VGRLCTKKQLDPSRLLYRTPIIDGRTYTGTMLA